MAIGKVAPVQPPDIECGHEVVKVIVGPQKKEFNIYKNLICAASKFFHAALNSNFIEGAEHTVTLPEEDPRMFQLVHTWLHSGRVADGVTTYMEDDACSGDRFWWRMYMMGDRLMLDRLRVLAVAQIQNIFTSKRALVPSSEFIKDLFDSALLPGLETYIIKHVVYWLKNSKTPSDWRDLPDAHLKFGQALAKEQIEDMAQKHGHPEVSASLIAMHKPLSPWKIAAVEVNHWRQPASCAVDRTKLLGKQRPPQLTIAEDEA